MTKLNQHPKTSTSYIRGKVRSTPKYTKTYRCKEKVFSIEILFNVNIT